jgi:ABC-type nitrate/sulfonate/bicarbonate transport system substrate-binding protein
VAFFYGGFMKKYLYLILLIVLLCNCQQKAGDKLRIGLIKPSLNHLPLQYARNRNPADFSSCDIFYFNSGWETNEALVNGKIDLAIMPFTYVWNDVSQGKKVKIVSFFERESDGIIAHKDFPDLASLSSARLGVLKNSTLEIIPQLMFDELNLPIPRLVYFRTPMDMAVALNHGEVDAICFYVPSIFNFSDDFKVIHWLADTFPDHTCCNIAVTDNAIADKSNLIKKLMYILSQAAEIVNKADDDLIRFASEHYGISQKDVISSLQHSRYCTGLSQKDIDFEKKNARIMFNNGYMKRIVEPDEIYYNILP